MRLVALLFCLLLPITGLAQTTGAQPTGTIAVEDDARTDAAIAMRIRGILNELDGYDDVTVTVASGIVTLRGTTLDAAQATQLNELVNRVQGVVAVENNVLESTDVVERLNPAVARFKARATQIVAFLPLLLIGLAVFLAIVLLGFFIAGRRQPWERLAPNAFIADIYRQILRLVFIIAGLVIALDILNATALLSGILGAAGIVGLAIGFAVRDTVENFIASIMLSVRQPFRPNDTVEIEGDIGKVIRLTSRATILLSFDGNHIRIPNATVFKSRIINYTRNAERRFVFELAVAPDTDLAGARDLALRTLQDLPFLLDTPEASAWIEAVGDSTVTLKIAGWIDQNETSIVLARGEAIRLTMAAFDAAGYAMPEPTYRLLHTNAMPPAPGTDAKATSRPQGPGPAPTAPQDVDASADRELEKMVAQERSDTSQDLLSRAASSE
jgi:small-conductance mechanosensitive channel